jgi:formylglycine-generating enzyme required for sulfatase activity
LAIQDSVSSRKYKCPICGRRNDIDNTFECVKCARDYLCIEHYNKISRCCEECAEQEANKEKLLIENAAMRVELIKRADETRKNEASLPIIDLGNGVLMEYVLIPAGDFMMGSNERIGENPVHRVEIVKPFYMSKYEVTQEQYERITGINPSHFRGIKHPVEQVSWNSAKEFCILLSQRMGFSFSLPTEAQWEYACRAGSTGKWCFGDDENELNEYAWYFRNSGDNQLTGENNFNELIENNCKSHPVGEKKPNAFGLYDMHGNVWEWCLDWFDEKYYGQSTTYDPQGPWQGLSCVLRGGGWNSDALDCRSANRSRDVIDDRNDLLGFRVIAARRDE